MGVSALEGRKGVRSVTKGWQGLNEVNHVVYDPQTVTLEQLIEWLKESGTYIRTLSETGNEDGRKRPGD